jgi:hypothetical protein
MAAGGGRVIVLRLLFCSSALGLRTILRVCGRLVDDVCRNQRLRWREKRR